MLSHLRPSQTGVKMSKRVSDWTEHFYYEHRNLKSGQIEQSCFSFGGDTKHNTRIERSKRREENLQRSRQMVNYLI